MLNRDFETFFRHVKSLGFFPEICLDVGAGYGTGSIYSGFPKAKHIVFEPLIDLIPRLKDRLKSHSHEIHNCALMSTPGRLEIRKSGVDDLGSSLMHNKDSKSDCKDKVTVSVPVKTLDSFEEKLHGYNQILLKTDCQGADIEVLKGGINVLQLCDIVIVESSLFRFWGEHHSDLFDIITFMNEQNFVIYDLLDGTYRPYDEALGQIDVAFVKRNSFLRSSNKWGDNNKVSIPGKKKMDFQTLEKVVASKQSEISHLLNIIEIKNNEIKTLKLSG